MRIFTRAILRKPGKSFVKAIAQQEDQPKPNYKLALKEYNQYAEALKKMGVDPLICEPDENFPDGNFVEDTYFILGDKLKIELNPGTPSRAGEPMSIAPYLPDHLELRVIPKEFTIDGGDILKDCKNVYVGLSKRTQQEAIRELDKILYPLGYRIKMIEVPEGLHLKSGMTCLLHNHFVIQAAFEDILKNMQRKDPTVKYFVVPPKEYFAANVLPINGKIMIPTECPQTKAYISKFYKPEDIFEVDTKQVRLVDGAITCSSLLLK